MIGLLLVTHDTLGEALLQCVRHVLNRQPPQVALLGVCAQDDPLVLLPRAQQLLDSVDSGQGVLVLTDIYGATPSNLCARLLQPGHVEGIAGLSLPMLLRALTYREQDLATLVQRAVSGGCDGVVRM